MELELGILNELRDVAHNDAVLKGFWEADDNIGMALMLIVSELSEGLEALREGTICEPGMALRCLSGDFEPLWFKANVKDTFEDELADALIRLMDLCGHLKIDIASHVKAKMLYNRTRGHLNGKRF